MLDISYQEKEVIELLRNLSGENEERIHNILLSLMKYSLMQYGSGESITIPLFGTFKIKYLGEEIDKNTGEKNPNLECFFDPSLVLRKNIGQYEDFKKGDIQIIDIDIFKYHKINIERKLKQEID
jgi:hypothetical protein